MNTLPLELQGLTTTVTLPSALAVVLPHGPEAAATVVAVAANAVCAPLNPGFTADELVRELPLNAGPKKADRPPAEWSAARKQ